MTTNSRTEERDNIKAAIDRLLAGTPLRSDGALTIVALAAEADVKRHLLTHRHTDLKDQFYARVRARGHVPDNERKLRDELAAATDRIKQLLADNSRLQAEHDALARIINVLEVENYELRRAASKTGTLIALPGANDYRS